MKSSQILASVLFGSLAAAVPFKRDLVTTTEVVTETVVCYTTIWDDEPPVAEATTTAGGYFYEQPASSTEAETTPAAVSTPAYTPPAVQEPSSVYTPPVQTPAPSSAAVVVSSVAPAPEPVETSAPAAPTTTEAAYTPAPVSSAPAASSAAPAPAPVAQEQSTGSTGSTSSTTGESFSGDLTINPLNGALGACGKPLYPTDFVVALAAPAWGASTYDTQTGEATNPWCGKKIVIDYNGKKVDATIMDLCPGCKGHDIDLSDAAWAAIGMTEWTRVQGSWSLAE